MSRADLKDLHLGPIKNLRNNFLLVK